MHKNPAPEPTPCGSGPNHATGVEGVARCSAGGGLEDGDCLPRQQFPLWPDRATRVCTETATGRPGPARADGASRGRRMTLRPGEQHDYRHQPCHRCPWRMDCDLTDFTEQDMQMLHRADGRPGVEAPVTAPTLACHLDQPSTAHEYRWCAGWLATVGAEHLAVRLALLAGSLPPEAVEPGPLWPALYPDLDDLLTARTQQLTIVAALAGCPAHRVADRRVAFAPLLPVVSCQPGTEHGVWTESGGGFCHIEDCALQAANWAAEQIAEDDDNAGDLGVRQVCREHRDEPADDCQACRTDDAVR